MTKVARWFTCHLKWYHSRSLSFREFVTILYLTWLFYSYFILVFFRRKFCLEDDKLPVDLHNNLSDIITGTFHFGFFYIFRYSKARALTCKTIFHSGPTINSGKTYHVLERFLNSNQECIVVHKFFNSKSGAYCGPLKFFTSEVYCKCNQRDCPCDLVTGEDRNFASDIDKSPCSHVSCTVEMI
jgi:ATP-dependent RNA helicase SUPV3L1/SUV3